MHIACIVSFAISAVGSVVMGAILAPRAERAPLALVHDVFAATGLVLLGAQVINGSEGLPRVALIIFLVAAFGGFYLFSLHLRKRALPLASSRFSDRQKRMRSPSQASIFFRNTTTSAVCSSSMRSPPASAARRSRLPNPVRAKKKLPRVSEARALGPHKKSRQPGFPELPAFF